MLIERRRVRMFYSRFRRRSRWRAVAIWWSPIARSAVTKKMDTAPSFDSPLTRSFFLSLSFNMIFLFQFNEWCVYIGAHVRIMVPGALFPRMRFRREPRREPRGTPTSNPSVRNKLNGANKQTNRGSDDDDDDVTITLCSDGCPLLLFIFFCWSISMKINVI